MPSGPLWACETLSSKRHRRHSDLPCLMTVAHALVAAPAAERDRLPPAGRAEVGVLFGRSLCDPAHPPAVAARPPAFPTRR